MVVVAPPGPSSCHSCIALLDSGPGSATTQDRRNKRLRERFRYGRTSDQALRAVRELPDDKIAVFEWRKPHPDRQVEPFADTSTRRLVLSNSTSTLGYWAGYRRDHFSGARRERSGRGCSQAKASALGRAATFIEIEPAILGSRHVTRPIIGVESLGPLDMMCD
jgi:hypothetical protein